MKDESNIKTFEDACAALGLDPSKPVITFGDGFPEKELQPLADHAKIVIITDAINREANGGKEWIPDWKNWDERKWYPWFEMGSPSGSGFSFDDAGSWAASSYAGSRLCFKTEDAARYAGTQFLELYKSYFVKE